MLLGLFVVAVVAAAWAPERVKDHFLHGSVSGLVCFDVCVGGWWLLVGGCWFVAWLVVVGWRLLVGGWWLLVGGWWLVAVGW